MQHFSLNNGTVFVLADAAGGVYNAEQIRVICEVADEESAFVKISEDQRLGFMVSEDKLPDVQKRLAQAGVMLRTYRGEGIPSPKACLGEFCPQKEQDALSDAIEISAHFSKNIAADFPFVTLGLNGCSQACAASATDDIHIVGEMSGYKISIGGKQSEMPQIGQFLAENISKEDLPAVLCKILTIFREQRQDGERLFDVVERVGMSIFTDGISSDGDAAESSVPASDAAAEEELLFDGDTADDMEPAVADNAILSDENELILESEDETFSLDEGDKAKPSAESHDEEELLLESDAHDEPSIDALDDSAVEQSVPTVEEEEELVLTAGDAEAEELSFASEDEFIEDAAPHGSAVSAKAEDETTLMEDDAPASVAKEPVSDLGSLGDEDIIVEEATAEDVDTMTRTIRSEVELEEQISHKSISAQGSFGELDVAQPEVSDCSADVGSDASEYENVAAHVSERMRVRLVDSELRFSLHNDMEMRVALSSIQGNLEIDLDGSLVQITRNPSDVEVCYGGITMVLPLNERQKAA